ncbi:hypothetical protein OG589_23165 [Sphaerisporangium sp. NBC_01403]|uniref:hypothetical protein n=1 Tax=Sphaerisporangium sp. NBC_01403 TaxID=2903599 RepID=UPI0032521291
MNIRVPDQMLDQIRARAADRRQTVQDYVASLINRGIDTERAAASAFIAEVLERDGLWLDELESR